MSVKFLQDFQSSIYYAIANDHEIRKFIDKIYVSVVQDARYPFLLINLLNVKNISNHLQQIYQVEFEICAFARDKTQHFLISLADRISINLTAESCAFNGYIIAGIKNCMLSFNRSQDLLTTKLSLHYQCLIKQELYYDKFA